VLPFSSGLPGNAQPTFNQVSNFMANYTYGVPPFTTTTFTPPVAGTSDVIRATAAANFTINGNGGHDSVTTGGGDDTISTTGGNDTINAGHGNNTVNASSGTNAVTTGSGNDTITTGSGNDRILAGNGNNTVTAGSGANAVFTGSGDDTITTGSGNDTVLSGAGLDMIKAGAGNDVINAGGGNDTVHAGTGNDRITGGGGLDRLIGGGGHDTFVYASLTDAMLGADTISDFSMVSPSAPGEGDLLNLVGLVNFFTGVQDTDTLSDLVASGHLDFSGNSSNTVISFDSNGSTAGGSMGTLVTLVGVPFSTESASLFSLADNVLV
jgi:Ca2+-binding RTX toxin-like protein